MPTRTGLPRVGERIRLTVVILGRSTPPVEGVVVRRTAGQLWSLLIRKDNGHEAWITTAGYYLDRGMLEVIAR